LPFFIFSKCKTKKTAAVNEEKKKEKEKNENETGRGKNRPPNICVLEPAVVDWPPMVAAGLWLL
jgi:hypothetical protein